MHARCNIIRITFTIITLFFPFSNGGTAAKIKYMHIHYICTINNVLFYNFFVKILSQQRFVSVLYHTSLVCSYVSTYCYLLITRTIRIIIVI